MSFYQYMTRNYKNEASPKGDLARDMMRERNNFPKKSGLSKHQYRKKVYDYFSWNVRDRDIKRLVLECWLEYSRHD